MEMRLPVARKPLSESLDRDTKKHLVVPGDTITTDTGFMRYVGIWGLGALQGGCWALHVASVPLHLSTRLTQGTSEHRSPLVSESLGSEIVPICVCLSPWKLFCPELWYQGLLGALPETLISETSSSSSLETCNPGGGG